MRRTPLQTCFLAAGIAVLCATSVHAQRTIRVPTDQPTIQAGIDAANNGDTVLVASGVYPVANWMMLSLN
jgi:hypothetical protein